MPYADPEKDRQYHNEWRKKKRRERGLQKQGRKCLSPEDKVVSIQNRERYIQEWRNAHPWSSRNIVKKLLSNAKKRAKDSGLEFSITEKDIIISNACPYFGTPMVEHSPRGSSRANTMSLDRIDSSMGYIPNNVEVISHLANTMKSNATREQLLKFAYSVIHRLGRRDDHSLEGSST